MRCTLLAIPKSSFSNSKRLWVKRYRESYLRRPRIQAGPAGNGDDGALSDPGRIFATKLKYDFVARLLYKANIPPIFSDTGANSGDNHNHDERSTSP